MKRTIIYYNLLLGLTLVAVSCIREPEPEPCKEDPTNTFTGTFIARAMDSLDMDISNSGVVSTVEVLSFTDGGNYIETQSVNLLQQITVKDIKQSERTLVGWGNLSLGGQHQTTLKPGDNIGLWSVSLIKLDDGNYRSPDNLFYGEKTIKLMQSNNQPPDELWLHRRVAAIAISTIGLQSKLTASTSDVKYIVRGTSSALNYKGEPIDAMAVYLPNATINSFGELEAKPFLTFASPVLGRVTVELYVDGTLLFSASNDLNSQPFKAINDRILYITLDMDKSTGSTFELAEWDDTAIGQNF